MLRWFDALPEDQVFLSALTIGEIQKGADLLETGERQARIDQWLRVLLTQFGDRILPVDVAVARRWGAMTASGQQVGRVPPPIDALIAATALVHGLTVATPNVADFTGTGASILNPWTLKEPANDPDAPRSPRRRRR